MSARIRMALTVLLLAGLALRLGWALSRGADESSLRALPDQLEYLQSARNLLHGEGLWFTDSRFDQRVHAARTIGYPLLVAGCGGQVRVTQVVQCMLDVSTAAAVFLMARRWLGDRRGLLACALVIFNPLLVYFCALVLTETLYVAMLTWSVLLVLQRRTVLWGILLCALSVHVRPAGLPMPVVLAVLSAWTRSPRPAWGRAAMLGTIAAVVTAAVLLPWGIRNQRVFGRFIPLTTNGGITLYDGVQPGATGASDQTFTRLFPEVARMGELERDAFFTNAAREEIRKDPWRIAGLAVKKTLRTWSPIPLSEQFSSRLYTAVGLLYTLPLLILAAAGLFVSALPAPVRIVLIAPAVVITVMYATSVGSMRYRLPVEPLLCVLASSVRRRS